jgi:hypothetical protein
VHRFGFVGRPEFPVSPFIHSDSIHVAGWHTWNFFFICTVLAVEGTFVIYNFGGDWIAMLLYRVGGIEWLGGSKVDSSAVRVVCGNAPHAYNM